MFVNREEGFSLIEVVAAVAVLGIVLVPVFSMFAGGTFAVISGGYRTEAVTLAQDGMEKLKGRGCEQLLELVAGQEELELEEVLGFYRRKVILKTVPLEQIAGAANGELLSIYILVSWDDGRGGSSVSLASFLGKGLEDR